MGKEIKFKKLTSVQVNDQKAVVDGTLNPASGETLLSTGIQSLGNTQKIVFVTPTMD